LSSPAFIFWQFSISSFNRSSLGLDELEDVDVEDVLDGDGDGDGDGDDGAEEEDAVADALGCNPSARAFVSASTNSDFSRKLLVEIP
jgi:hypothetical protein